LTHVPYEVFQSTWNVVEVLALEGGTPDSYSKAQRRLGKPEKEIQDTYRHHEVYWDDAVRLINDVFGGVEGRIYAMTDYTHKRISLLRKYYEQLPE
jgi:hypothetical protein